MLIVCNVFALSINVAASKRIRLSGIALTWGRGNKGAKEGIVPPPYTFST
jgi:hypothetical protein